MKLDEANRLLEPGYTELDHCHEEMSYLSDFLPALYTRETGLPRR